MRKILSFNVAYDEGSDVLYITKRRDTAARGVEDENGIVWRYDRMGDVLSATVMDFQELWATRYSELAEELSRGLHIPALQAMTVLSHVREGHGYTRQ